MMDELDLLKKDWQRKGDHFPKVSSDEIHQMIWKKSSSIVKWIFIISILEFIIPHLVYFIPSLHIEQDYDILSKPGIKPWFIAFNVVYYSFVFFFMYQFYKRYKEITVSDSAKILMVKILKTKKTVTYYVICALIFAFTMFMVIALSVYFMDDITQIIAPPANLENASIDDFRTAMAIGLIITGMVFTLFFAGFYYLLYGLLLRKLNRNYRELKKMEM